MQGSGTFRLRRSYSTHAAVEHIPGFGTIGT